MSSGANEMTDRSVCAVIVTYHPGLQILENISRLLAQAQELVVVDNGSSADELGPLRAASRDAPLRLIENGENLGIAEALNRGVLWAKERGFPWVVLFDQDTTIPDGFVAAMQRAWEQHPERARVASIHPSYMEPDTGLVSPVLRAGDGGPVASMTSGALMPAWTFDKLGLFASEYFIDLVDTEYCLRIRAGGYLVADAKEVMLPHSPGHPRKLTFLGFSFRPTNHSAARRYYFARNRVALYRKYLLVFPVWIAHILYLQVRELAKCILAEEDRAHKLRNSLLGAWDGFTGRMGRRDGL